MEYDMKAAVAKGAALLDEHKAHWWEDVDTSDLDMELYHKCVIGQVYRALGCSSYNRQLDELGSDGTVAWASEHGFDLPITDADPYQMGTRARGDLFVPLTDEWQAVIAERRQATGF